jgi:putative hemolysin
MKKLWIFLSLLICCILVVGCHKNCNCNCEQTTNENETTNVVKYCIEHGWTHTLVENAIWTYWKCTFPNGLICEDQLIWTDSCNLEPNLEDIDTEEERMYGCEQNVSRWMDENMEWAVFFGVEWDDETDEIKDEAGNITIIRKNFYVKYDKDWYHWKLPWTCEASFLYWILDVIYGQTYIDE